MNEPFSFHNGGINLCMGDRSCRFLINNVDALVLKAVVSASDGATVSLD